MTAPTTMNEIRIDPPACQETSQIGPGRPGPARVGAAVEIRGLAECSLLPSVAALRLQGTPAAVERPQKEAENILRDHESPRRPRPREHWQTRSGATVTIIPDDLIFPCAIAQLKLGTIFKCRYSDHDKSSDNDRPKPWASTLGSPGSIIVFLNDGHQER